LDNVYPPQIDILTQNEYLKKHLIAYIGNKRSLLSFLGGLWLELLDGQSPGRLLDPFAGSGAASRLARSMGFEVWANDWEDYAATMNHAHLCHSPTQAEALFTPWGGLEKVFDRMNQEGLREETPAIPYFSRYYSPADTDHPRLGQERLFFTQENGRFLDRARGWIEDQFPPVPGDREQESRRSLLISSLIYQASVHSNTNGVFKAYHKGFGGHGKDALSRILRPMGAQIPVLMEGRQMAKVWSEDAKDFVTKGPAQIAYLDPPYNQHQYGSNYHILNSVALWDRPEVDLQLNAQGVLIEKAGIRKDWRSHKSPYCQRSKASGEFAALLERIEAPLVTVSYNTEGIIPFERLYDMLSRYGRTTLVSKDYVKYRGGRQSNSRRVHNLELLFVLDKKQKPREGDWKKVARYHRERKISLLAGLMYNPKRIYQMFSQVGETFRWRVNPQAVQLEGRENFRWEAPVIQEDLDLSTLDQLSSQLEYVTCGTKVEEVGVLLEALEEISRERAEDDGAEPKVPRLLLREVLASLKKFAFKKYEKEYNAALSSLEALLAAQPAWSQEASKALQALKAQANLRFQ
jgi:adenine-specific DNA-methyltransferase